MSTNEKSCHVCYKRVGRRINACSFCGNTDAPEPKMPASAPSSGLVPVTVLFPKDVYQSLVARSLSLSLENETHGISEIVSATMRRTLAG